MIIDQQFIRRLLEEAKFGQTWLAADFISKQQLAKLLLHQHEFINYDINYPLKRILALCLNKFEYPLTHIYGLVETESQMSRVRGPESTSGLGTPDVVRMEGIGNYR